MYAHWFARPLGEGYGMSLPDVTDVESLPTQFSIHVVRQQSPPSISQLLVSILLELSHRPSPTFLRSHTCTAVPRMISRHTTEGHAVPDKSHAQCATSIQLIMEITVKYILIYIQSVNFI
jgi:hypothetical protein